MVRLEPYNQGSLQDLHTYIDTYNMNIIFGSFLGRLNQTLFSFHTTWYLCFYSFHSNGMKRTNWLGKINLEKVHSFHCQITLQWSLVTDMPPVVDKSVSVGALEQTTLLQLPFLLIPEAKKIVFLSCHDHCEHWQDPVMNQ